MSDRRIPGLDGLRAISILIVIASHVRGTVGFPRSIAADRFYDGPLGVDVFFVISGFLITWLLLDEEERHGRIDLRAFYTRRALRILPPALAYLAAIAIVNVAVRSIAPWEDVLACVFFCRNLFGDSGATGHFWSLSVEEQFYLVWPLLFLVLPRASRLRVAVIAFAIAPVWRWFNLAVLHAPALNFGRADLHYDTLTTGVILALVRREPIGEALFAFAKRRGAWLLAIGVLAIVAMHLAWLGKLSPLRLTLRDLALGAIVLASVTNPGRIAGAILEAAPVRFLGRISYSLYLWQQIVLYDPPPSPLTRFPVNLAVAFALACASFFLVERPILAWRDGRRAKRESLARPLVDRKIAI